MRKGIEIVPKLGLLLGLTSAIGAVADSTRPVDCRDASIRRITRPYVDGAAGSRTFEYAYRWEQPDRTKAVFIYIPGGPGQTSIRQAPPWLAGQNVILTDPRGVGCNERDPQDTPDSFYRSVEIANDILAVIEHERLNDYVLYGTSFGTVVATQIAALVARKAGVPAPKALLLEGVMGRASRPGEWEAEVARQWGNAKKELPEKIREKIDGDAWPVPTTPEGLGEGISQWLTLGKGMVTNLLIGLFTSTDEKQQREIVRKFFHYDPKAFPKTFLRLHRNISCREFSNEQSRPEEPRRLIRGKLVPGGKTYCAGIPYSERYFVENWPVRAPIFYFVGENDPATPVWQAEYHFEKQARAPRLLTVVGGGAGHGPLSATLYFADGCGKRVLEAIATASFAQVGAALRACRTPLRMRQRVFADRE